MKPLRPQELHRRLLEHYGPSGWWPGDNAFEIMVGAILTQNTNWTNVEKAINNLKAARMLSPQKIHAMAAEDLAELIRPAGYFNVKASRLRNFVSLLMEKADGDPAILFDRSRDELRDLLLNVKGVGRETADSIICYAAGKEIFVIDAYTRRILERHGITGDSADYDELRLLFEKDLPRDIGIYKDLHAWLVFVGKDFCRPRKPACESCPLQDL